MRVRWSRTFDEESTRFALRFCCEDCAHFDGGDERAGEARCRHDWPTALHRRDRYRAQADGGDGADVVFCKEFELC
jgi:hypothetical protein